MLRCKNLTHPQRFHALKDPSANEKRGRLHAGLKFRAIAALHNQWASAGCRTAAQALYNTGTISKATMLMILISGLTAGPAVSL
jgi:hypothetical protein